MINDFWDFVNEKQFSLFGVWFIIVSAELGSRISKAVF